MGEKGGVGISTDLKNKPFPSVLKKGGNRRITDFQTLVWALPYIQSFSLSLSLFQNSSVPSDRDLGPSLYSVCQVHFTHLSCIASKVYF